MIPLLVFFMANLLVGLMGTTRRSGFWLPFFASFLLTPVGGAIVVLLSGKRRRGPKPKRWK